MNILFLSVGKKHEENIREAIEDYTKRIGRFCEVSWQFVSPEIEDVKDKDRGIKKEGEAIVSKLQTTDRVILLDERGKEWNTVELSESLAEMQGSGVKRLVFIIGGAYGVSDLVKDRSQYIWSLSKLTFPHMLVRLILSEQIYRASSILQGSKYHHE